MPFPDIAAAVQLPTLSRDTSSVFCICGKGNCVKGDLAL